jgi:hypothetical protein
MSATMKSTQSPRIARPERWLYAWDTAKPVRRRRQRKPSVATLIKRAEKAGKTVTAITTPEGMTLTFGEAADKSANEADNELARWRQQKKNAH